MSLGVLPFTLVFLRGMPDTLKVAAPLPACGASSRPGNHAWERLHEPHGRAVRQCHPRPPAHAAADRHDARRIRTGVEFDARQPAWSCQPRRVERGFHADDLRRRVAPQRRAEQHRQRLREFGRARRGRREQAVREVAHEACARALRRPRLIAGESRRAASNRSAVARSSGDICWRPASQREIVDCATPNSSAAWFCLTRCSARQR